MLSALGYVCFNGVKLYKTTEKAKNKSGKTKRYTLPAIRYKLYSFIFL